MTVCIKFIQLCSVTYNGVLPTMVSFSVLARAGAVCRITAKLPLLLPLVLALLSYVSAQGARLSMLILLTFTWNVDVLDCLSGLCNDLHACVVDADNLKPP